MDRAVEKLRPTEYKRFETFETVYDREKWSIFPSESSEMRELMKKIFWELRVMTKRSFTGTKSVL